MGSDEFLRFFALMSAALAAEEGQPFPLGVQEDVDALHNEIRGLAARLKFTERMEAYQVGLRASESGQMEGKYSLLQLDIESSVLTITLFENLAEATAAVDAAEFATSDEDEEEVMQDAVLVSVDSINTLRAAYPNYFLDMSDSSSA